MLGPQCFELCGVLLKLIPMCDQTNKDKYLGNRPHFTLQKQGRRRFLLLLPQQLMFNLSGLNFKTKRNAKTITQHSAQNQPIKSPLFSQITTSTADCLVVNNHSRTTQKFISLLWMANFNNFRVQNARPIARYLKEII